MSAAATPAPTHNSLQRVQEYPIVKSSLSQAYSIVQSNSYSQYAYAHIEALSSSILARLEPLQHRLPIETVDGYANAGLDFVEKRFPAVNDQTDVLLKKVRKPSDDAVKLARSYADGITSRLSPVTEQFSAVVAQSQETIHKLQERLSSAIASLPRDKASASEALSALFKELEATANYISTHAKELPANARSAAQPVVEKFGENFTHIKEELSKPDLPLSTKATNVLSYTQEQVTPLLNTLKEAIIKKKSETETAVTDATPTVNGSS
ncbi:hypothetical protein MNV49_007397 [Pseudohyphozyma bogoriensis]|nr:hypothetical protein MNV49_007397 [Pseudohyphozyma bogoriensis]